MLFACNHLILSTLLLYMSAICQSPLALGTPMMAQKKSSFMALRTSTSQWWPYASHRTPTTLPADRPTKHGAYTDLMASARIAGVMPPEADWYTCPYFFPFSSTVGMPGKRRSLSVLKGFKPLATWKGA